MAGKQAVMYGGGNIGRGFIGQLLYQSGYEVGFVDVNRTLLAQLGAAGQYPVRILHGETYEEIVVRNVHGIDGSNAAEVAHAIAQADICATAVGVNALKFTAKPFRDGIVERFTKGNKKPLNIIICENLIGADSYLRGLIADLMSEEERAFLDQVGFVEASIGRMVPVQTPDMQDGDPLRVCVEAYDWLPVDKAAFVGEIPNIRNLVPCAPFSFYIKRKLFIHNMGHAAMAYLGQLAGCTFIWEAAERPEIVLCVQRAMLEAARALSKRYGVALEELLRHIDDLLFRFANRQLGDTIARVGGDIRRKLSPGDRLAGAFRMCEEQGVDNGYIALAIAASLSFTREGEEKLSPQVILWDVLKLDAAGESYERIVALHTWLTSGCSLMDIAAKLLAACAGGVV